MQPKRKMIKEFSILINVVLILTWWMLFYSVAEISVYLLMLNLVLCTIIFAIPLVILSKNLLVTIAFLAIFLPYLPMAIYLDPNYFDEQHDIIFGLTSNPLLNNSFIAAKVLCLGGMAMSTMCLSLLCQKKSVVQLKNGDRSVDRTALQATKYHNIAGIMSAFLGIFFLVQTAPKQSIFQAKYTESASGLVDAGLNSGWMLSVSFLSAAIVLLVNPKGAGFKVLRFITLLTIIIFIGNYHFLRGDREFLPYIIVWVIFAFYRLRVEIKLWNLLMVSVLLLGLSTAVDALRSSSTDASIPETAHALVEFFITDGNWPLLFTGTWSAVSLTLYSAVDLFQYQSLELGQTYVDLFLSIPPKFLSDMFGYIRPIDVTSYATDLTYGLGGAHVFISPLLNFGPLGLIIFIHTFFTVIFKLGSFSGNRLNDFWIIIIAGTLPHFVWYGDKLLINSLIYASLISFVFIRRYKWRPDTFRTYLRHMVLKS